MSDLGPTRAVQNYSLYGEAGDLPDVVHIETIETRSRLHDWTFPAHRHGRLHQVLLLELGSGQTVLDGENLKIYPMQFVNVPIGTIHAYTFQQDTRGWVLTLASEMMDEALEPSAQLHQALTQPAVAYANQDFSGLFAAIANEFEGREFGRAQALRSLSGLLLGYVARALVAQGQVAPQTVTDRRLDAFLKLIDLHFAENWSVATYAHQLGITPVHLTRICTGASGKPASRLIDERIIHEARRSLVYTNLPISTIGYTLGFTDPGYFSRVFARVTGMSPRRFRNQIEKR